MTHLPVYGKGMHDFILDELELGTVAAMALDNEACGFGPLFDLHAEMYFSGQFMCALLESMGVKIGGDDDGTAR